MQSRKRAKPVKFGRQSDKKIKEEQMPAKVEKAAVEKTKDPVEKEPQITKNADTAAVVETEAQTETIKESEVSVSPITASQEKISSEGISPPTLSSTTLPPQETISEESHAAPTIINNSGSGIGPEATPGVQESQMEAQGGVVGQKNTEEDKPSIDDKWPLVSQEKKEHSLIVYFFIVTIVAFLLGLSFIAGGYYALHGKTFSFPKGIPGLKTATPIPTHIQPTPTITQASKSANLSQYTIAVLNGSGITGEAAKVKSDLTTQGFNIVTTGNADASTYTKTQISAKKSVDSVYIQTLKTALSKTYSVDVQSQVPDSTQQTDVIITVGSSKSQ